MLPIPGEIGYRVLDEGLQVVFVQRFSLEWDEYVRHDPFWKKVKKL